MEFLKEIGILPPPISDSFIKESLLILFVGVGIIVLFCRTININYPKISIRNLIKKDKSEWERKFYKKLVWQYPIWGFIQQFFMVLFFVFIRRFVNDFNAVLITSSLFVVLHYPNLFLGLLVFGMEQMLLNHFLIYRNLYVLGIFHGFFATLLLFLSPSVLYTKFYILTDYIKLYKKDKIDDIKEWVLIHLDKFKNVIERKLLKDFDEK